MHSKILNIVVNLICWFLKTDKRSWATDRYTLKSYIFLLSRNVITVFVIGNVFFLSIDIHFYL